MDNSIINKKANLIFTIYLVCLPIIMSLLDIIGLKGNLRGQLFYWACAYCVFLAISVLVGISKGKTIKIKFTLNFYSIMVGLFILIILISSCVNTTFNMPFFFYITYFVIFACVFLNDTKSLNNILNLLIIVVAVCCIMGFIDPSGKFMPGFNPEGFPLALQFGNPNYSGAVVCALTIVTYLKCHRETNKRALAFYGTAYVIFITHMFMNGSFAPISAIVIAEIFALIYFSVKEKKLSFMLLSLSIASVAICFLVDLIPNIESIRTCRYNYFIECIAVFDNIFGSDILSLFNIENIAGADGWNRNELMAQTFRECTKNAKNFIFGCGAGTYDIFRPHNVFLCFWVDFGILMPISYYTFLVGWFIKSIRIKDEKNTKRIIAICTFLLGTVVSSVVGHSYFMLIILLAIQLKNYQQLRTKF